MATCLALICLGGIQSAEAFEDNDCQRLETVPIAVEEDIRSGSDSDAARARSLDRVGQLAIAQVIGVRIQSSRETQAEIVNDTAEARYQQADKSFLSGLVRIKVLEETRRFNEPSSILSVRAEVTVCVPTQEFLARAEKERAEKERRPPAPADPTSAAWFDPRSGEPRLWYSRGSNQKYEFFDNSGFHPITGDKLLPVDKKVAAEWKAAAEREARAAAERAARERKEAAEREERERLRREAEAQRQQRLANATELCDQFAANPLDPRKPQGIAGSPYELLRANVGEAIEVCEAAAQKFPAEQRYRYQMARAYQVTDPKRAIPILQGLMAQGYPASFDNYGWALIDKRSGRNDIPGAVASFRRGADLGDPQSMYSLAELISQGQAAPRVPNETSRLYQRAASLGHPEAAAKLQVLAEAEAQAQAQRLQNEQAAKMFMGIVGGVLGAAGRR